MKLSKRVSIFILAGTALTVAGELLPQLYVFNDGIIKDEPMSFAGDRKSLTPLKEGLGQKLYRLKDSKSESPLISEATTPVEKLDAKGASQTASTVSNPRCNHKVVMEKAVRDVFGVGESERTPAQDQPAQPTPPPGASEIVQELEQKIKQKEDATTREKVLERAFARQTETVKTAQADYDVLRKTYTGVPLKSLAGRLARASLRLNRDIQLIDRKASWNESERQRIRNFLSNARDKADRGLAHMSKLDAPTMDHSINPFIPLETPPEKAPEELNELRELFSSPEVKDNPTSDEALVNRMIMTYGIEGERPVPKLQLREAKPLAGRGGPKIQVLHNGFLMGGGETAVDCSSFVSSLFPVALRQRRLTTTDFYSMWYHLKTGTFPEDVRIRKDARKVIEKVEGSFLPINLYEGEPPDAGDIMTWRIPEYPNGHTFIVTDYDPKTYEVTLIEAAQTPGTIRKRTYPLYSEKEGQRYIRPGITILRLRTESNRYCEMAERRSQ